MLVIKVGGGADIDYPALCDDITAVTARGIEIIVVLAEYTQAINVLSDALPRLAKRLGSYTA